MPRLHARGHVVAGVGDGIVSLDGAEIARGGAACWLNPGDPTDRRIVFQRSGDWKLCQYVEGVITPIATHGANTVRAGGGIWAAWLRDAGGTYDSRGLFLRGQRLADVANDGALALIDESTWQTRLGAVVIPPGATDVQAISSTEALWKEGATVRTAGLPPLVTVPGEVWKPRAFQVGADWWIAYASSRLRALVVHPFASTVGYVIDERRDYFSLDALVLGDGRLRVAWALREGELPIDIVVRDRALSDSRVELSPVTAEPPHFFDFPRWQIGSRYDERPEGRAIWPRQHVRHSTFDCLHDAWAQRITIVKFGKPFSRTVFDYGPDDWTRLAYDFTLPETHQDGSGPYGVLHLGGRWFPRRWPYHPPSDAVRRGVLELSEADRGTAFDVTDSYTRFFNADGTLGDPIWFPYRRWHEWRPATDFGGDIGVQPTLAVYRDSRPWFGANHLEISFLIEGPGDSGFENGGRNDFMAWSYFSGERIVPDPVPPRSSTPALRKPEVTVDRFDGLLRADGWALDFHDRENPDLDLRVNVWTEKGGVYTRIRHRGGEGRTGQFRKVI